MENNLKKETVIIKIINFSSVDSKGKTRTIHQNGKTQIKMEVDEENNEEEEEEDDTESLLNIKYEDPGAAYCNQDNDVEESDECFKQIHGLACALLQISQSIDVKYFKPPFGNLKSGGKNGTKEENAIKAKQSLEMWQVSLMQCKNPSQLFLHYNVLYDAIKWTRSAQNAKCVCRSSKDPDKLLLCDGCNIGRHIYCLKPKLTVMFFGYARYISIISLKLIYQSFLVMFFQNNRKCLKVIGIVAGVSQVNSRDRNAKSDKRSFILKKMKMKMM